MTQGIKSYEEFMADIKLNYEYHQNEANKFRALLNLNVVSVSDDGNTISTDNVAFTGFNSRIKYTPKEQVLVTKGSKTFEDEIIDILQDGKPRTVRMLSTEYKKRSGREYDRKEFASRLATIKKLKGTIRNMEYRELPTENRFWWGLAEWFNGEILKGEFKEKIFRSLGVPLQHSILH